MQDHQHTVSKESIRKQFLKKYIGVEFNYKIFQETTSIHLEQHPKKQTLIQMIDCNKDTQKFQKV